MSARMVQKVQIWLQTQFEHQNHSPHRSSHTKVWNDNMSILLNRKQKAADTNGQRDDFKGLRIKRTTHQLLCKFDGAMFGIADSHTRGRTSTNKSYRSEK
eukprot:5318074-Amphidinium_carterae.1